MSSIVHISHLLFLYLTVFIESIAYAFAQKNRLPMEDVLKDISSLSVNLAKTMAWRAFQKLFSLDEPSMTWILWK